MGDIYLDWLPTIVSDALRPLSFEWAIFDDDWLHRARSSGGYDELPLCVVWHHTAGTSDAWADAEYQCYYADAAPIANITIDSEIALILAGGATNTNGSGSGSPMSFSRGTVERDNMNRRAVGIELCNNGVGQPYPQRQLDAMFAISNAINARCGNVPADVCTHEHYAPERKIDPSTAAACEGPWQPRSINSSGSWSVDDLRAECTRRAGDSTNGDDSGDSDDQATTEDDMIWRAAKLEGGAFYLGDGKTSYTCGDAGHDISSDEALLRMAPGAVNVARVTTDGATDESAGKSMITSWGQIKTTMKSKQIRQHLGANPGLS